jgi:hypothetical protein
MNLMGFFPFSTTDIQPLFSTKSINNLVAGLNNSHWFTLLVILSILSVLSVLNGLSVLGGLSLGLRFSGLDSLSGSLDSNFTLDLATESGNATLHQKR